MVAAAWGLGGIVLLLLRAITRMWPAITEAFAGPLGATEWAVAAASLGLIGFLEGYRGFQKGFSPRVVARAGALARRPRLVHALLAPLYCMGLIHATRRRLVTSWTVVTLIVGAVLAVGALAQPYRGLVDAGVVLGLAWGLVALVAFAIGAATGAPPRVAADLP